MEAFTPEWTFQLTLNIVTLFVLVGLGLIFSLHRGFLERGGSAKATSAITVNTNEDGVATLSLRDSVAESVAVNASANGAQGQATATFVDPITAQYENLYNNVIINRNTVTGGLRHWCFRIAISRQEIPFICILKSPARSLRRWILTHQLPPSLHLGYGLYRDGR